MERIKLVVFKEHTLGYILPELPDYVQPLRSSILRGATFSVHEESVLIDKPYNVRLAKESDFDDFRCQFSEAYKNESEYLYAKDVKKCTLNAHCSHHDKDKMCLKQDYCSYKW